MRLEKFREKAKAFTLVEMLVVLGTITTLASFILPAVSSGRERARRAVCASNLYSIGQISTTRSDYDEAKNAGLYTPSFIGHVGNEVEKGRMNLDVFECPSMGREAFPFLWMDYECYGLTRDWDSTTTKSYQAEVLASDRIYDVNLEVYPPLSLEKLLPSRNHDKSSCARYCNGLYADGHVEGEIFY